MVSTVHFGSAENSGFAQIRDARTGKLVRTLISQIKRNYNKDDYISGVYGIV